MKQPTRRRTAAVGAKRDVSRASADYYPTPPWATRALLRRINAGEEDVCLEPAAGGGHMADILGERFGEVVASDLYDPEGRGWGGVDFLTAPPPARPYDWLITNPPFTLAADFIERAPLFARRYAFLARLQLLEGKDRYRRVWSLNPPSRIAVFTTRVAMVEGRLAPPGVSSPTCFAWFIWDGSAGPLMEWIAPDGEPPPVVSPTLFTLPA